MNVEKQMRDVLGRTNLEEARSQIWNETSVRKSSPRGRRAEFGCGCVLGRYIICKMVEKEAKQRSGNEAARVLRQKAIRMYPLRRSDGRRIAFCSAKENVVVRRVP